MRDLCILFGRPRRAPDVDDRLELEALAAEELGIDAYSVPLDLVVDDRAEEALERFVRRGRSHRSSVPRLGW